MYGLDLYGRVRLPVLGQGISQREAARRFGIDRGSVSKMLAQVLPLSTSGQHRVNRACGGPNLVEPAATRNALVGKPEKQVIEEFR